MKWFTYFDNSVTWHGGVILLAMAKSITEADAKFKATYGYEPRTKNTVGVTITDCPNVE